MATGHSPKASPMTTTIEVFADVRCPFTHVGLRRIVERRDVARRPDVRLWIRAWPLELVNDAPLDRSLVAEEVDELRAQVAPDLFQGFREERLGATSLPALGLAASAYERSPELGERVSLALRWALFEDGLDISDPAVLAEVARQAGMPSVSVIDPERVVSDWREGQRRGVIGSPHFFVGEGAYFCPSLDIGRGSDGRLRVAVDDEALSGFLARCFET